MLRVRQTAKAAQAKGKPGIVVGQSGATNTLTHLCAKCLYVCPQNQLTDARNIFSVSNNSHEAYILQLLYLLLVIRDQTNSTNFSLFALFSQVCSDETRTIILLLSDDVQTVCVCGEDINILDSVTYLFSVVQSKGVKVRGSNSNHEL